MSKIKKKCTNCEHFDTCEANFAIGKVCDEWEESELSKCKRKLKITMEALKYCSGATDGLDCNDCADEALKRIKEIDNE